MTAFQFRTDVHQRFSSSRNRSDGDYTETVETKKDTMEVLRPGGFICDELAVKRGLGKVSTFDRHGASVSLQKEIPALTLAIRIWNLQGEYAIRDDTEF